MVKEMTNEAYHIPVMLNECIEGLNIKENGTYVDLTFGGGGHSREILKHIGPQGKLYVFDQDSDAANNIPDDERCLFINHNFKYIKQFLQFLKAIPVDGILADLGISSFQINEKDKGFAHRLDGPLDMRMDQNAILSAADIVNGYDEKALLDIFNYYGEIKNAFKLVKEIIAYRQQHKIESIATFKEAIANCIPPREESKYLSQVFQALRIEVNNELKALETMLENTPDVLASGGRLVIMSYHSLEDRLVKNFLNTGNVKGEVIKDHFGNKQSVFKIITKKPVAPSEEEITRNKRARSAKLRIAEKI
jgi:16S rRNA (cytosine1402-N4)-methyltransferase